MAEENQKQEEKKVSKADDNTILVGKKPAMSYVLAAMTQFSDGAKEINIKARGRAISRAVDVAEVIKNRFVEGIKYDIEIGTETIKDERGSNINVSTINIKMSK